jgi:Uma2 family endonuclease
MNIPLRNAMTVDDFLAWAGAQSEKPCAELINGQIVAKYPDQVFTVAEYLAWAATQPERQRTELINGQIVAMTPERVEHVEVKIAAAFALKSAIAAAGVRCHALGDGMTVRVDDHTAYEPDAVVYCGEKMPRRSLAVPNPVIVVEVLSPTTAHSDTSAKLVGYFKLKSVSHYLVIDPEAQSITHHTHVADGTISARTLTSGPLRLDPPGIEFETADLFE